MKSRMNDLMATTAMGVVLALSVGAVAQESTVRLPQINVAGEPIAQNTTTIDKDRLARERGSKLDEVLRSIPGVFTRENEQQPGVAVNIRGFEGSGRVNMSIDGVRQSFRFTGHEAGGFTYVDQNLLAGIDVMRGEVTGVGGGALAGSVNFRTLGVDDIVDPGKTVGGMTRLSWGDNGVGFQEMVAGGVRLGAFGIAGAISHRNSNNFDDGNDNKVFGTGQDLYSGLIKTNYASGAHSLSLGAVFYDNDFYANSYDQTVNNKTYTANYRYNPGSDLIDLRLNAYYNLLNMKYTGGSTSALGRTIEDEGAGFDISNASRFNLGTVTLFSTNGVEYFHDDVTSQNNGVNPSNGTAASTGVFTENTFRYGIVDLTGGLRYNHYELNSSGATDLDISKNSLDPKITLAVNVTPWLQPYVSWGKSMRAPTLQETLVGGNHPGSTGGSYIANANLRPEKSEGWEFGANIRKNDLLRPRDSLMFRANYFVKDIEDYIVATFVPTARAYQYQNVAGTSTVKGWEIEARYDAGFAFGGVSYTQSNSDLASQQPGLGASQYLPDDIVTVDAGLRFLDEALTIGSRYNYVSDGTVSSFAGTAGQGGKAYNLVGLYADYKVNEAITVSSKVTNLMNESYTPFLSTTGTGQGRTFYVSTQIKF